MNINDLNPEEVQEVVVETAASLNINNIDASELSEVQPTIEITPEALIEPQSNIVTGSLEKQMNEEKSIKQKTIDDIKANKANLDPADYDQQLRDASRLGKATTGEVSDDVERATEYSGVEQTPVQTYEGDIIQPGLEPEMEATLAVLDLVTAGTGAKTIKGVGGLYDEITEEFLRVGKKYPKSQAAQYMEALNQGRMTEKEFGESIKNIPIEEQAILLGENSKLYSKYFKGAIDNDDRLAARLGKRFEMRKNVIAQYSASEEQFKEAGKSFGNMKKTMDEQAPTSYTTSGIKDSIKAIENIYKTDPTPMGTTIRNIALDVGDDMSVGKALDLRENINAIIRKPNLSKTAKGHMTNIKNNLDSFIDVSLKDRPDLIKLKDDEINKYRQVVNDYQLGMLIKKNTKNDFAVDWEKLRADVKKNKLSSDNLDYAKPILKDFENRFVNDKKLADLIIPSGAGKQNILSLISKIYGGIIDVGHRILRTDRAHGLVIQKEIRKSLGNSKNKHYNDFIDELMNNPKIPKEAKDEIKPIVDEIKTIK